MVPDLTPSPFRSIAAGRSNRSEARPCSTERARRIRRARRAIRYARLAAR